MNIATRHFSSGEITSVDRLLRMKPIISDDNNEEDSEYNSLDQEGNFDIY